MSDAIDPDKKGPDRRPPEPRLTPPGSNESPARGPARHTTIILVGVGLLLVVLALAVVFLPMAQDQPLTGETTAAPAQVTSPPRAAKQAEIPDDRAAAARVEDLIGDWLRLQAQAEAENVTAWGADRYNGALEKAADCERLFRERAYLPAQDVCADAIAELDRLLTGKQALLAGALERGELALSQGEAATAAAAFQKALDIDPANGRAMAGQARAAQLPQVLQHIEQGQLLEAAGDRDGALQEFATAMTLDPDFAPAREHRDRVKAALAESAFRLAMSQALRALEEGRLDTAAQALAKARAIRPEDPAVKNLRSQLANRQRTVELEALRRQSDTFAREERWADALQSCTEALALDAKAAFAAACQTQARQRLELERRVQGFLDQPERLFDDALLAEARQLSAHAATITPAGARLSASTARLNALITEAAAEVTVVIKSDGLTDIAIYHVGRLGRFEEKQLTLRTGNYTATASRAGYRDQRQVLRIRPGQGAQVFTLVCEEPI